MSSPWVSNFFGFLWQHSQMKAPRILGPLPCFDLVVVSENFREVMRGLISDNAQPQFVLDIDARGLGNSLASSGVGESPSGRYGWP